VDEDALIQAVREAPDDQGVRLVYADWLEERGDARADFLRLECALHRMTDQEPGYAGALACWLDGRERLPAGWLNRLDTRVNGLPLPWPLARLLAEDRWASTSEVDAVYSPWGGLYTYSQATMESETRNVCRLLGWLGQPDPDYPPGDIHPDLTVLIADEGIGSDAPFALDYRTSFAKPRVVLYRWRVAPGPPGPPDGYAGNRWVEVAPTFQEFWQQLQPRPGRPGS
jgi:uncharacterized protein (TIGR02996 family)